ncbi:hypothetical protein L2E82_33360 [Cichorium intybus]|uniref:Uncharacterized protein n=1 Tax=Cichorium intybus TaxID=13427 RepID=A0ACB9BJX9_CICIN|nr:hypothetical protein L2E82_33360 [Cichorium intybus]
MGVHGLWDLLSPVGRRVSVETLAGKRLAIDASIWMIQFMKAMRDEHGEMVRNAHILGFFRRICKLLFLRTKPVFVFDGATPALKRRTVIARRRQRENAQTKIRKTAEKLLLNHLKAMRLKELANDLENQRKNNGDKGKRVIADKADLTGTTSKTNPPDTKGFDQEALDAMLAASIEAEENEGIIGDASTSGAGILAGDEDEDEDDDEEMLIPTTLHGKVDPAVLASLPPSMQLDLLGQMRERLMAENRQKYQKVKKAPARFSELQIEAYLKTVAFRREIHQVQKAAGGTGIDGVQTSRIASESNREFIFSSSFTGNRQSLASNGIQTSNNTTSQMATLDSSTGSVNGVVSTSKSNSTIESFMNEPRKEFSEDVETYRDDRGRVRISKVRAMGIRMTRDLQRNLDLIKEIEHDKTKPVGMFNERSTHSNETEFPNELLESSKLSSPSYQDPFNCPNTTNQETVPVSGTSLEVSFEYDKEKELVDSDDDLFASIVAEDPLMASNASSAKQPTINLSDSDWEEGMPGDVKEERPVGGCSGSDGSEVEWEEGPSGNFEVEYKEPVSKGDLLEEADFQEAIRRSMNDMRCEKDINPSSSPRLPLKNVLPNKSSIPIIPEVDDSLDKVDETKINNTNNSPTTQFEETALNVPNLMEVEMISSCQSDKKCDPQLSIEDVSDEETLHVDVVNQTEKTGVELSNEQHEDDVTVVDGQQDEVKDLVIDHISETTEPKETSNSDSDTVQKPTEERDSNAFYEQKKDDVSKFVFTDVSEEQVEITKASLEEEMTNLTKERTDLGDEQRRLERNAESVSGEMFAECQELLQMFGLPYIIAPMEAEAQCAYMELENLVDGVVTDDSDVLLFGARSVYKNIFDDRKYVETYFMKDIETELGLTREKLICMAMLLGSDYTEGISGIGIVNAVEVLNAFPEEDGLQKFREWIESPDPNILGKVGGKEGSSTRAKRSNGSGPEASTVDQGASKADDDVDMMKQIFMDKHRNVSKNWHIPSTFPSDVVISAYASPQVDKSTEPFSWGKPDLFVLRRLCFEKFGWGTQKADELLQPVLKEYNKHETQLRLEAFYSFNERFAKIRSKRISKAVKGIAGSKALNLMDDNEVDASNGKKRKKVKQEECKDDIVKEQGPMKKVKGSGVRGRGRGRGKGKGQPVRNKEKILELSGTSSDDGNNSDYMQELHGEDSKGHHEVRRSKRVRKSVISINNEDSETEEPKTQEDVGNVEPLVEEETVVNTATICVDGNRVLLDEAELDSDWCQNDENVPEPELSKDYLQMGGGFCLDEDEGDKEPGESGCSPSKILNEASREEGAEASISPNVAGDDVAAVLQGNNDEDEDGMRPVSFLSGIPNLRRKRKKI